MRRSLTPCAVGHDHTYLPLRHVDFSDRRLGESFLQDALHRSPRLLPVDEIDSTFGPIATLGREVMGIDNLFISPSGRLTLVETKLWRNPESGREVVGQILDYASALGACSWEDLEMRVRAGSYSPLKAGESLYQYAVRAFATDTPHESEFIDATQKTLRTGRFLLLIVGDGIREGVERMLDHLHQHPQRHFTFGLVEIGIYENPAVFAGQILLPSLVAKTTEVIRAVVRVDATGPANVSVMTAPADEESRTGYRRRTLSEQEFLEALPNEATRQLYDRLLEFAEELGAERTWRASSVSLRLPDPKGSSREMTLMVLDTDGRIFIGFLSRQLGRLGLPRTIASDYVKNLCRIFEGVALHKTRAGTLSRKLNAAEVAAHYLEFTQAVRATVEAIQSASAAQT